VINYDLPAEAENYVHRIGRTARAGKTGKAFSFASEQDVYELPAIERYIGKKIPSEIAGRELYEKDKSASVHIQTDFYEERFQDKRNARRGPAGKTSFKGRRETARGQANKTTRHGHNKKISFNKELLNTEAQSERSGEKNVQQDISRLSMEERMVFYKKKYALPETKHGKIVDNKEHVDKQQPIEQAAPVKKNFLLKFIGLLRK